MKKIHHRSEALSCELVVGSLPGSGVEVLVEFCATGNYRPVAVDLARAIAREFGESDVCIRLAPSHGGRFEVSVDGRLIFSKRATYRIPAADEIFYHVAVARTKLEKRLACAV